MTEPEPSVDVRKVAHSKGDRLEIAVSETRTKLTLDALALESLTWQTPSFVSRLGADSPYAADGTGGTLDVADAPLRVINEYSQIEVTTTESNGDRLRIAEHSDGYEIELTPPQLACIATEEDLDFVTRILSENPFGPDIG